MLQIYAGWGRLRPFLVLSQHFKNLKSKDFLRIVSTNGCTNFALLLVLILFSMEIQAIIS